MFTGIVEEAGTVQSIQESPTGIRLQVAARVCGEDARLGDSIAVNGCCLTVVDIAESNAKLLTFDLLRETWNRTNFSALRNRSAVNLERALPANGRLHGHFVTGHIDETGTVDIFEKRGADWYLRVKTSPDLLRYIVFKGSIAIDGISLTIAEVTAEHFAVWIIPHTYEVTALRERKPGDLVNLEADLLAKYVAKLTPA
ncbi:MAG TPA: riboflavin synthase [Verrucomicrobiae bacterium]